MIKNKYRFIVMSSFISCSLFLFSCASNSINFLYDGHVYIKTTFYDTISGNFLYDTGAPNLILDSTFVEKNRLKFKDKFTNNVQGVGNNINTVKMVSDKLYFTFDKQYNYSRETYLVDLKKMMGQNIDGILGIKTFKNRTHKIDFIKKKLTFTQRHRNYDSIQFVYDGTKILIPIDYVIDKITHHGQFILDLGSAVTTFNSTSYGKFVGGSIYNSNGGLGGVSNGKTIIIDNLKLGTYNITNYPIDYSTDSSGALSNNTFTGILGTDVLDDFDIIIDLEKKILYLKANQNNNKHYKIFFKSFSFIDNSAIDKSWIINYIYLDTDAYRKGLRLNDKILEIDGEEVSKYSIVEFYKNLKVNQKLDLKILREQEILNISLILNKFLGEN